MDPSYDSRQRIPGFKPVPLICLVRSTAAPNGRQRLGKSVNQAVYRFASATPMVAEKTLRFEGKNWNLNDLADQIQQQLQADGYKTQLKGAPVGTIIQAQKAGILRDIITADRAFTIMISGQPNDFTVHIGIGKWVQNIAVAAVEALLISVLFLAVDVPEILWTTHVEKEIIRKISDIASKPTLQQTAAM